MSTDMITPDEFYALRDSRTDIAIKNDIFKKATIRICLEDRLVNTLKGQALLLLAVNISSRLFRNLIITSKDIDLLSKVSIFGNTKLKDEVVMLSKKCDPFISIKYQETSGNDTCDFTISIGNSKTSNVDVYIDGDLWNAYIGKQYTHEIFQISQDIYPLGGAAAVCFGIADALKKILNVSPEMRISNKIFSLYDLTSLNSDKIPLINYYETNEINLFNSILVGVGAVGSSFLYFLKYFNVLGDIDLVDHDIVDISNLSKSPIYFFENVDYNKVDIAKDYLNNVNANPYAQKYSEFIEHEGRKKYDIMLPLADKENVRWSIQNNIPPYSIQTSTSSAWGVIFGRHIPLKDDCIACRFPPIKYHGNYACGEGLAQIDKSNQSIHVALPFQPVLSGIILIAEIIKLSLANYPQTTNYVSIDMMGDLSPKSIVKIQLAPNSNCICNKTKVSMVQSFIKDSKYYRLSL